MTWAKLDDRFPSHPKVARAGGDAAWLYVAALCYANEHLTDGVIPSGVVGRLTDRRAPDKLADKLVSVGLWERRGDDFFIHDYLDTNDPADVVRAKRDAIHAKRSAAGLAGGRVSAQNRFKQSSSKVQAKSQQATDDVASTVLGACFDHDPSKQPSKQPSKTEAKFNPDSDSDSDSLRKNTPRAGARVGEFDFDPLYARYPRHEGRTPGMRIARREIKTAADLADLGRAVDAYAARCRRDGTEKRYTLQFGTFMGRWRDYLEPELAIAAIAPQRPSGDGYVQPRDVEELLAEREAQMAREAAEDKAAGVPPHVPGSIRI